MLLRVLRMKRECTTWVSNLYNIHCGCFSSLMFDCIITNSWQAVQTLMKCLISARPCPINLFSFKFGLIFHIRSEFWGNVNTNVGESLQKSYNHLQTSYDHYKCLAINKNGLRLLMNMLRICFSYEFGSMFLIFARPWDIAPDKAAYCVFTQFRGPENAIKLISVRTKTQ